jgi:hypothetical protein
LARIATSSRRAADEDPATGLRGVRDCPRYTPSPDKRGLASGLVSRMTRQSAPWAGVPTPPDAVADASAGRSGIHAGRGCRMTDAALKTARWCKSGARWRTPKLFSAAPCTTAPLAPPLYRGGKWWWCGGPLSAMGSNDGCKCRQKPATPWPWQAVPAGAVRQSRWQKAGHAQSSDARCRNIA